MEPTLHTQISKPVLTILVRPDVSREHIDLTRIHTAAPPAMVPKRQLLISITFFTVWLAIQFPAVALESVATTIPPLNRNARVVVPWASLIGQFGFAWSSVMARRNEEGYYFNRQSEVQKGK